MSEEDYQRGRRGRDYRVGGDWDDWNAGRDDLERENREAEGRRERQLDAEIAAAEEQVRQYECPYCRQPSLRVGARRCPLCRSDIGDGERQAIQARSEADEAIAKQLDDLLDEVDWLYEQRYAAEESLRNAFWFQLSKKNRLRATIQQLKQTIEAKNEHVNRLVTS